jgi:hypothetical protein
MKIGRLFLLANDEKSYPKEKSWIIEEILLLLPRQKRN